jgi:hypothetical protein
VAVTLVIETSRSGAKTVEPEPDPVLSFHLLFWASAIGGRELSFGRRRYLRHSVVVLS